MNEAPITIRELAEIIAKQQEQIKLLNQAIKELNNLNTRTIMQMRLD